MLVFIVIVGYVYDLLGRKWTLAGGVALSSLMALLIPYTAPSLTMLIIIRTGMILGMSVLNSHPLVNDYVVKQTRGRALAL